MDFFHQLWNVLSQPVADHQHLWSGCGPTAYCIGCMADRASTPVRPILSCIPSQPGMAQLKTQHL